MHLLSAGPPTLTLEDNLGAPSLSERWTHGEENLTSNLTSPMGRLMWMLPLPGKLPVPCAGILPWPGSVWEAVMRHPAC